jgi:Nif-specific regulatory protein
LLATFGISAVRIFAQTAEESGTVSSGSLEAAISTFERDIIIDALKSARGNITAAARLLDTSERIVGLRLKKYRIEPKQYR